MSISVAMATYNGEKYLEEQLQSILEQTTKPDELVVCDDGSTDSTGQIVAQFAHKAPFPVTFHVNDSRLNYADNFMGAAQRCRSDFIAFCDQDDIWAPGKLTAMVVAADHSGANLIVHAAEVFDEANGRTGRVSPGATGLREGVDLLPFGFYPGFTMMVKRSVVEAFSYSARPRDLWEPERGLAHDRWICFLASILGSVYVLDEELARYRQHQDNASGWMRASKSWNKLIEAGRRRYGYDLARHYVAASELSEITYTLSATRQIAPEILDRWEQSVDSFRGRMEVALLRSRIRRVARILRLASQGAYRKALVGRPAFITLRDLALAVTSYRDQRDLVRSVFAESASWPRLAPFWG